MKQFLVALMMVTLALGLVETEEEKQTPSKTVFGSMLTVYHKLSKAFGPKSVQARSSTATGGNAANRAFLSKRSNSYNPNHNTFNPPSSELGAICSKEQNPSGPSQQ
jgi:hypothetical protein